MNFSTQMKSKNSETPIQLPSVVRNGDPITAKWANSIRDAIQRLRDRTPINTPLLTRARIKLPFCYVYSELVGEPPEIFTKLLGGIVTGGPTNYVVDDITLELTDGGSPKPDGTRLFLKIYVTAITADDVLMPGIESVDDVTTEYLAPDSPDPANILPTNLVPTGLLYVSLGVIMSGKFLPAECGDKIVYHCPGSLTSSAE
jgi:hypothetical protein